MQDWRGEDAGVPWAEVPEEVGVSSSALERLDYLLRDAVESHAFPMTQALVVRKGKAVYFKGFGDAHTQGNSPLAHNSIFRIYSQTKCVTSVALMMLFEEGKFTLDQPVHIYLGEKWRKGNLKVLPAAGADLVPCEHEIRIKHLFTHTAGLSYGFQGLVPENPVDPLYQESAKKVIKKNERLEELVDRLATLPLCNQPGEAWNYSYATDVLGRLVEVISGMSLGEFFRTRIFRPLGMHDTMFHLDEERYKRLVCLQVERPDGTKFDMTHLHVKWGEYTKRKRMESGGGGLVSTMRDYSRFLQFCLNKGELDGVRLLGRKTFEFMTLNHLPGDKDLYELASPSCRRVHAIPGLCFGLGFAINTDPGKTGMQGSPGMYYWGGAASTVFWVDPIEDMFVLFYTQVLNLDDQRFPLRTKISNVVYSSITDKGEKRHHNLTSPLSRL